VFPWVPPNNDRITCFAGQIISGSFSIRAFVNPVDEERSRDNQQSPNQHRYDHCQEGQKRGDDIFCNGNWDVSHAAGRCRDHWAHCSSLGNVNCPSDEQATGQRQYRADVGDRVRAGGEGDRACCRADERLHKVIEMVDRRELIGQHLDDHKDAEHQYDPRVGQSIPGGVEFDQVGVMPEQADDQDGVQ